MAVVFSQLRNRKLLDFKSHSLCSYLIDSTDIGIWGRIYSWWVLCPKMSNKNFSVNVCLKS